MINSNILSKCEKLTDAFLYIHMDTKVIRYMIKKCRVNIKWMKHLQPMSEEESERTYAKISKEIEN